MTVCERVCACVCLCLNVTNTYVCARERDKLAERENVRGIVEEDMPDCMTDERERFSFRARFSLFIKIRAYRVILENI